MISEALKSNNTLTYLDMYGDKRMKWIKVDSKKKMNWTATGIGETEAILISEGLKKNNSLTEVVLSGDEQGDEKEEEKPGEWKGWKKWKGNNFGESGFSVVCDALKKNSTLITLDLSCNGIWNEQTNITDSWKIYIKIMINEQVIMLKNMEQKW